MTISIRSAINKIIIVFIIFVIGFVLSSGVALDFYHRLSDKVMTDIGTYLYHHILTLFTVDARHYFLLPEGGYTKELANAYLQNSVQPIRFPLLVTIFFNGLFNILFQPVFLCLHTPQSILNLMAFPFFLYGIIRYFRKIWGILIIFLILSFRISIYDSGVEALIRHGMICELLYLLIGSAGFASWITKNS